MGNSVHVYEGVLSPDSSKDFFGGLNFQGSLFAEGLIVGGNFAFHNRLDFKITTA